VRVVVPLLPVVPSASAGCTEINQQEAVVAAVTMRELLEAGVHFGHQTRRWDPKMRRFIFGERGGIYIIDLEQTLQLLEEAAAFSRNVAERGGTILFVGTKKQAQDSIEEQAKRVDMPYVNHRWLGGLLTNWRTISGRIDRLHELRRLNEEGQLDLLPPKERISMVAELERLESHLGGVADMKRQPDALLVVDLRKEAIAVREARRLGLPVVALVDTNCDPDEADYVIPGNDDAIKSCDLVIRTIADAMEAGKQKVKPEEFVEAPEAQPPVRDSGPVEGVSEEPGGSPGPEEGVENRTEPAAQPPVRDSGPVEGVSGEPGGSSGPEEGVEKPTEPEEAPKPEEVPAE
jgi:small subunit ribosomal protein S2